jgi:hypothetical protein
VLFLSVKRDPIDEFQCHHAGSATWIGNLLKAPALSNLAKFEAGKLVGLRFSGNSPTPAPELLASGPPGRHLGRFDPVGGSQILKARDQTHGDAVAA